MDEIHRQVLRRLHLSMVKDLETGRVLDHMYQSDSFSDDDCAQVNISGTRRERCQRFLDILPRRGDKAYHVFLRALEKENLSHLAEKLRRCETYPFCEYFVCIPGSKEFDGC